MKGIIMDEKELTVVVNENPTTSTVVVDMAVGAVFAVAAWYMGKTMVKGVKGAYRHHQIKKFNR
jgi:hypothetical protein